MNINKNISITIIKKELSRITHKVQLNLVYEEYNISYEFTKYIYDADRDRTLLIILKECDTAVKQFKEFKLKGFE